MSRMDYQVFGAQGPYVEALVTRCEKLTSQEAELLARAWSPLICDQWEKIYDDGKEGQLTGLVLDRIEDFLTLRDIDASHQPYQPRASMTALRRGVDRWLARWRPDWPARSSGKRMTQAQDVSRRAAWEASRNAGRVDTTTGNSAAILWVDDVVRCAARQGGIPPVAFCAAKAAKDAVIGVAARDLISEQDDAGWGCEQYRTLTDPWRSVIGPTHPADSHR